MPEPFPFVSVVIPVKNEAEILGRCFESLKELNYPKDRYEVVIADGLSTDDSRGIAQAHGAHVIVNEVGTATAGRNRGVEHARGDLIAFTDADCVFDPGWLRNSIKYFDDPQVAGVSGVTAFPEDSSHFEKAVNFLFDMAADFSSTVHRQAVAAIRESGDLPGCNAIYRKDILKRVMPIDEDLLTAEDVWLGYLVAQLGYKQILVPDVKLWHYRRSSPTKLIRQMCRYAIARLQAGRKSSFRLLRPLHCIVGFSLPIFLIVILAAYLGGLMKLLLMLLIGGSAVVIVSGWIYSRDFTSAVRFPMVLMIFAFAWSWGFLRELFFPMKDVRGK